MRWLAGLLFAGLGSLLVVRIVNAQPNRNAAATPQTLAKSIAEEIKNVTPTGSLTRAQVEALCQKITATHFPWVDWRMLAVMCSVESSFKPTAKRTEYNSNGSVRDVSYGLMQLLTSTANWLFSDMGARAYGEPTVATLSNPEANIFFGAAYVSWLRHWNGRSRSEEWIVRAYNGGPGWGNSAKGLSMTANHWAKYQRTRKAFYGF